MEEKTLKTESRSTIPKPQVLKYTKTHDEKMQLKCIKCMINTAAPWAIWEISGTILSVYV